MMLTLLTRLPVTTTAALPTMAQPRRFTFSDTKEHSMHRMILAAAAATLTLTAASAGLAQARVTVDCAPGQRSCVQQEPQQQRANAPRQDAQGATPSTRRDTPAPRIGESGRSGQHFQRAQNSRFNTAPRGQEYRVVNDHLVLVHSRTLAIVSVVGLLSTLLN